MVSISNTVHPHVCGELARFIIERAKYFIDFGIYDIGFPPLVPPLSARIVRGIFLDRQDPHERNVYNT